MEKEKEIIVSEKNRERIQNIIDEIQKRCKERLISFDDIVQATQDVERVLDIPKKYLDGVVVVCDINAQKLPNSYKYTAYSTQFTIFYKSGRWRVKYIKRWYLSQTDKKYRLSAFPEETKKAILQSKEKF